jgi:hypothetical protein
MDNGMDPLLKLNEAASECDSAMDVAEQRRNGALINDRNWIVDVLIALHNFQIQAARIRFPELQDGSAELHDLTAVAYLSISDIFPFVIPACRPKALHRDGKVFHAVATTLLDETGWNHLKKPVRIVPREFRDRTWEERFSSYDVMDRCANLKEVIQYHASLPEFGSFKTIERQYSAAKKRIRDHVYADTEKGIIKRDPLYGYLIHLNMMNVDWSKIEGPKTV